MAIDYLGGICVDCGNIDPRVMQFDHVTERRANGPTIASRLVTWSWERIKVELDKCQLRCANCHQIRTRSGLKFTN